MEKDPEKPNQEFGKYVYDKLDPVLVEAVFGVHAEEGKQHNVQEEELRGEDEPIPSNPKVDWTVLVDQLRLLQVKDEFCKRIIKRT